MDVLLLVMVQVVSSGADDVGANVNKTTCSNDHSVLSLACTNGHLDVVKFLLRSGADVTHRLKVIYQSNRLMFCYCLFSVYFTDDNNNNTNNQICKRSLLRNACH